MAFVGISLDNVLPQSKKEKRERARAEGEEDGGESGSDSESGSGSDSSSSSSDSSSSSSDESSEPVYQLRERRTNITSYRYNEYDELIKSALQDEIEAVKGAGNAGKGKDISNIVDAEADEAGEAPQAGDVEGIVGEKNENAMEGEANNLLPQGTVFLHRLLWSDFLFLFFLQKFNFSRRRGANFDCNEGQRKTEGQKEGHRR